MTLQTKSQYTPGPWMIQGYQDNGYNIGTEQGPTYKKIAWASSNANARLIAAAPELLSALKGLNHMGGDERGGYCICPLNDGSAPDNKHTTSCAHARQAIIKAEGTQL